MRIINPWVLLFSLLAVVGCGDGGTGSGDASTEDAFGFDASQDGGGETDAGGESDAGGCTAGEPGCACAPDGSCNGGDCVDGLCVACPVASSGCACRTNGTCDTGLRCNAVSTRCEACPAGDEGCACAAGDSCGLGLVCMSGMCVLETCAAGSDGCPCRSASPACDGAAYCDGSGLCQTCSSDVVGCPCDGIACRGGLTCDTGRCRTPLTCASLRTAGTCAEHQACVDSPGADGVCMPGVCDAGYRWVSASSTCVACVSPGCSAEPTCAPGLPNSLACGAENRVCGTTDGVGSCGACLEGFLDVGGVCQPDVRCGSSTCTAAQYCDESMPSAPVCRARCAGANDAFDTAGTCIRCASCAGVPGSTGRVWATTNSLDECLCETEPGYFIDPGGTATPVSCDADGDGWVRQEAIQVVDRTPVDPALLANMRCTIRTVQRFVLADEYGTESTIESCESGLLQDRATETTCTPRPVRLYEIRRNDVDDDPALATAAPAYAAGGRVLRANERNSMTKLCVSVNADFDGDGSTTTPPEDLRQVQPMTAALNEAGRIRAFSHFGELYRMIFVPPVAPAVDGTLRIEERSRCDAAFPLAYDSRRAGYNVTMPAPESYWRNCERRRTPSFNRDAPGPGSDFGQWSCSATEGSCPAAAAPANPMYATMPTPPARAADGVAVMAGTLVRDHGLCELNGDATESRVFRGMNHHSQFQCVEVVADSAMPQAHQRRRVAFDATGTLVSNGCQVPAGSASRTLSDGSVEPAITCAASTALPAAGSVVWAAVKYQPYGDPDSGGTRTGTYAGGCVNETAEWPALCPSTLFGLCSSASQSAFGRYCCFGCDNPRLPAGSPGSYVGCSYAHGLGSCNPQPVSEANPTGAAACSLATCDPSWGNCDGNRMFPGSGAATGCETNISISTIYCGDDAMDPLGLACDARGAVDGRNTCNLTNTQLGTNTCVGGVCSVGGAGTVSSPWLCNPNYGNCDGVATETPTPDGCESNLVAGIGSSSIPNCGGCGVECNPANAATWSCPATSTTSTSGVCTINSCRGAEGTTGAYRNVDRMASTGCECQDDIPSGAMAGALSNSTSYAPPSSRIPGAADELALRNVDTALMRYNRLPDDTRAAGTANYGPTVQGKIPYDGAWSDWWSFSFYSGATTAIELVTGPEDMGRPVPQVDETTSEFVFEVFTTVGATSVQFPDSRPFRITSATGLPPSYCGSSPASYTRFSWRDNFSLGNTSRLACVNGVCAAPTTGWVRVRRRVPTSSSCNPYYLRIRKLLTTDPYS